MVSPVWPSSVVWLAMLALLCWCLSRQCAREAASLTQQAKHWSLLKAVTGACVPCAPSVMEAHRPNTSHTPQPRAPPHHGKYSNTVFKSPLAIQIVGTGPCALRSRGGGGGGQGSGLYNEISHSGMSCLKSRNARSLATCQTSAQNAHVILLNFGVLFGLVLLDVMVFA